MERRPWTLPGGDDRVASGVAAFLVLAVVVIPAVGLLWRLGLPREGVRLVGALPDAALGVLVTIGLVLAWRRRQTPDALDLAVGLFVLLVVVLLVLGFTADPWDADVPPSLQLLGARALCWGLLLLVALRSVVASPRARERVVVTLLGLSAVVAGVAVGEALVPDAWEWFGTVVLGMHDVQQDVYDVIVPRTLVVRTPVAGRSLVRAGSLLFEYLQLGFWLLPALGAALARVARRPSVGRMVLVVLLAAGVAASLGRAALACAVVVYVAVLLTRSASLERRRLAVVGAVGLLGLVALAVPTGLAVRLVETLRGSEGSTWIHADSTAAAVRAVADAPLGGGLGTGFAASARVGADARIAENAYLDVAVQAGLPALALMLVVVALLWRALWRRRPWDDLAVSAVSGLVGLTLGGLLLHTWQMLETSWLVLALCGLALPRRT